MAHYILRSIFHLARLLYVRPETFGPTLVDGDRWSMLRPGRFTPGKDTRYPLCRRLIGPQGRACGHVQNRIFPDRETKFVKWGTVGGGMSLRILSKAWIPLRRVSWHLQMHTITWVCSTSGLTQIGHKIRNAGADIRQFTHSRKARQSMSRFSRNSGFLIILVKNSHTEFH